MTNRRALAVPSALLAVTLLLAAVLSACANAAQAQLATQSAPPTAVAPTAASNPAASASAQPPAPASTAEIKPTPDDASWDPDYTALEEQIGNFLSDTAGQWSVYFEDLDSGTTFGVNDDLAVPAASTVKVPVVLYAAALAAEGKLSMNERLTYLSSRDYRTGSGSLQYTASDGDKFTIAELCEKAIVESDNVAWKMLERRLGVGNIAAFMESLGGDLVYPDGQNISTARDMATYMEAAMDSADKIPGAKTLMYDLAHTIWNTGLNRYIADEVTVAHKEGDVSGVSNDVGIVYADHPYIVAVMSKGQPDVEAGFEKIGELSKMIYNFQEAIPE